MTLWSSAKSRLIVPVTCVGGALLRLRTTVCWSAEALTVPRLSALIVIGGAIVRVKFVGGDDRPRLSVTVTVTLDVPEFVGVPLSTPGALRVSPTGSPA